MVLSWSEREPQEAGSPWVNIEALQREARLPCLLVPQPAHAVLAGALAEALLPDGFGVLPQEIVRAIQMHDTGWASSDAQQIQRLRADGAGKSAPLSFVAVPPGEAAEAWTASIESVETLSKAGAVVVSRHFSRLAQKDAALHKTFLQLEAQRQRRLESASLQDGGRPSGEDFDRWTAALVFCDLVSLYLLSGLTAEAEFDLAHSASPAPVRMQLAGRSLRFSPAIVRSGSELSIQGLKHPLPAQGARAETLSWRVEG